MAGIDIARADKAGRRILRPRIFSANDARRLARRRMPRMLFDFVDGGSGGESALRRNRAALNGIRLQPRVLGGKGRGGGGRGGGGGGGDKLGVRILGEEYGVPFGIAPMGMCDLTWPGADGMLVRAANARGMPLATSMAASTALEETWRMSGRRAWFQLYVGDADSLAATWRMVARAQKAGYKHLILTADVPRVARRGRDLRNGFGVPFRLGARQFFDFACHPRWVLETVVRGVPRMGNFSGGGKNGANGRVGRGEGKGDKFVRGGSREGADWGLLGKLRARWRGKLIVKGVLSPADARRAKDAGADAVYVSNHGGRQLDSAPAAIHMLPRIRAAVGATYPLIFDGGVRGGEDVVKALALGANLVMLGRAPLYAIGADGARGLAAVLDMVQEEVDLALAQLGVRGVGDLSAECVVGATRGATKSNRRKSKAVI